MVNVVELLHIDERVEHGKQREYLTVSIFETEQVFGIVARSLSAAPTALRRQTGPPGAVPRRLQAHGLW